jgi:hypothetical protein
MKFPRLLIPTTRADVWSRSAIRLAFCALPYLVIASLWAVYRDDRLFYGFGFWWCVVLIPGIGLVLDLWRFSRASSRELAA